MEMFPFIKNCLLTHNYPLAHSMNEEEIANIFKTTNRCFLVCWMLKLLDSTYETVLENFENDKEALSNHIYELGFCTKNEKSPFMTGELPVAQQVKIIFNMFTFIKDIKKCKSEDDNRIITSDELTVLDSIDLNLFPMYGDIKVLDKSERILTLSNLEKEINSIKSDLSTNCKTAKEHMLDRTFINDIEEFMETLKIEFPEIKSIMEIINMSRSTAKRSNIKLKTGSAEPLKKCCENLEIICEFIKDINTIEDFEKQEFDRMNENKNSNNHYEMMKVLYREVLTILKYNRCL